MGPGFSACCSSSLFWAVGLGMLYFWYRGRYGKIYVLVERDRLVVRFVLGKREKIKEYVLNENSRADLVESYKQNERPVYAVAVSTAARAAKFGTFLAQEEKVWIVERINRHLQNAPPPSTIGRISAPNPLPSEGSEHATDDFPP